MGSAWSSGCEGDGSDADVALAAAGGGGGLEGRELLLHEGAGDDEPQDEPQEDGPGRDHEGERDDQRDPLSYACQILHAWDLR